MSLAARKRVKTWRHALDKDALSGPQYRVAMAVAYYADNDCRNAFPSKKLIAEDLGMSVRQVQRILEYLEDLGLLAVEGNKKGGRGKSTHYRINPFPEE